VLNWPDWGIRTVTYAMAKKSSKSGSELPSLLTERLAGANESLQIELARIISAGNVVDESDLLRAVVDFLPDYLFVKDLSSRFLIANKAVAVDLGVQSGRDLTGRSDLDFLKPEIANQIIADDQRIFQSGEPLIDFEELLITRSGTRKWLSTTKLPLRDRAGDIIGILGLCRDITDRKRADLLRSEEGRILEMIVTGASLEEVLREIVLLIEAQLDGITGSILLLDEEMRLRHGAAPNLPESYNRAIDGVAIGPNVGSCGTAAFRRETIIVSDITIDPLWESYRPLVAPFGYRSCWSAPVISHDGNVLGTFAMYSREVRTPSTFELKLVATAGRIAGIAIERRVAEKRIHHMAHHDALTGLPNRALLKDRLAQLLLYAGRFSTSLAVAFIDLDNFKLINDNLGHNAGDKVLQIIARRLNAAVTARDTVVRLGGDEFVILFLDPPDAERWFGTLRAKIAEPIDISGHNLRVTCSAGLVSYPADGADVETLLANADVAMYSAKESGRDNLQRYSVSLKERTQARLMLQEGIRGALKYDEFKLVYQPQVDLRSGMIFAAEALIRWQHPQLGVIYPNQFIPEAEDTGQIVEIGEWVLTTACQQCKAWHTAGFPRLGVSVNVSARQFREESWVSQVDRALSVSGLPPECLDLEVTESLIMEDIQRATQTMRRLKDKGVQLSIDDFGTGYSNLNALRSFPLNRLKIDQSFIRAIPHNQGDATLARAIISLGQQLHLRTLAEGVDKAEQLDFLKASGCDEYQGYLFSEPLWPAEFMQFIKRARHS
jgi:diguanylate cyclase (GGDEF)-like protein/PAS domain S-box-containing protein